MTTEKGGRPKYKIDYQTLDGLCEIQCTGEEIAAILNVDYDTLNRRLKEEGHTCFTEYYKLKSADGKMSLRRKQHSEALAGNSTMLIWLGKQHLKQTDFKAVTPKYKFKIPDNASPIQQATFIIQAVSEGNLPADIGVMFINAIKASIDIEEYTELKQRIDTLERTLNGELS